MRRERRWVTTQFLAQFDRSRTEGVRRIFSGRPQQLVASWPYEEFFPARAYDVATDGFFLVLGPVVDDEERTRPRCPKGAGPAASCDPSTHLSPIQLMNRLRFAWTPALMLLILPGAGSAQAASERANFTQIVSGTEIEIAWSRPSLRGREVIFGRQIPWGEVWTPGANMATTIRFSKDVVLSGTAVPAGHYSVWLRVMEEEPWRLALHADTVLPHSAHPPIEEAVLHVPVERGRTEDLQESLEWDVDRIRIDGAELVMHWGRDRVTMPLEVEPGIPLATPAGEARPLLGDWMYDDSPSLPTTEQVERFTGGNSDDPTARYFEVLLSEPRPRPIRIGYDEESGLVRFVDLLTEAAEAAFYSKEGEEPVVIYGQALLPRGSGAFAVAGTFGGEVSAVNPRFAPIVEFDFDADGQAVSFTIRNPDDEVQGTGVRVRR